MATDRPTDLGNDIDGGIPGQGRTLDEAIDDAFHNPNFDNTEGWYKLAATFIYVENPIREYKVVITPGG